MSMNVLQRKRKIQTKSPNDHRSCQYPSARGLPDQKLGKDVSINASLQVMTLGVAIACSQESVIKFYLQQVLSKARHKGVFVLLLEAQRAGVTLLAWPFLQVLVLLV